MNLNLKAQNPVQINKLLYQLIYLRFFGMRKLNASEIIPFFLLFRYNILFTFITFCYIIQVMNKMYYVSYETAKEKLNLLPQNESQDRISLMFCNQLVKNAIEEMGIDDSDKSKYLETIVLRTFNKTNSTQKELEVAEIFEAVKDCVMVV